MARFTIREYSDFGMEPQDQTRILFESDSLSEVKEYIERYFRWESYFNAVYFIDNEFNKSGYVGRKLTINCGESLSHFCELPDVIKKKIKDLTVEECEKICFKHMSKNPNSCARCPFYLVGLNVCLKRIKEGFEKEVEVDE